MTGWLSEFSDPADQRNVERLRAPDQPLPKIGAFQGFGEAVKDGLMIGGAGVARAGQLAGSTVLLAQDHLWGLDPQADGSAFKQYMDATEPVVESAEDYWKIDSETTGTAGQIAGGLSRIVLPLMAGAGNPTLLASSETAITATDALDAGATANQAVGIGLAQGAAVAVGAKIPVAFGKTLGQKVVTGALANTALGVGVRAVQSGIAGDNEQLSQMYDPFDSTSLAVDLGIGATFGAIAGLAGRRRALPLDQQDAIAAAEVETSINSSMPDPDARPPEAQAHRTDLDAATRALEEGAPVQPRTVLPEDSAALAAFAAAQAAPATPRMAEVADLLANLPQPTDPAGFATAQAAVTEVMPALRDNLGTLTEPPLPSDGYSGSLDTLHGSKAENLQFRDDWNAEESAGDKSYFDNVFGDDVVYLGEQGQAWSTRNADEAADGRMPFYPHQYDVGASFENAFVLTPQSAERLAALVPNKGIRQQGAGVLGEATGADVVAALKAAGYDGLIIRGFGDDVYAAGVATGIRSDVFQNQIVAFKPSKLNVRGRTDQGINAPVQPILSPTGNPFLSDVGAEFALESQGLQATHEVREVRGGYAIFPKSDAVPVTPTANSGKVELTENGQSITIQPTGANATPVTSAQSPARAPTQPLSPVKQGIATAAEQAGIDPTTALVIGHIETGGRFNADAQNPTSSANGLFQVIKKSWEALGGGNRADPAEQIRVGLLHMKEVEATLTSALGRKPTTHESYMGHLLGAGGARIVLTADPNARLYDVVYGYTKAKTEAQRVKIAQDTVNNNGMRGLTVGEAIAKWQAKTNQVARLYSDQARGGAAFTPAGDRVEFIYDVVEVGDLTTSHNNDLSVNDLFPSELQPRDRDRAASIEQANDYANRLNPELLAESPTVSDGAPIVGMDGVVESGNIRTISRRLANERGLDAEYRQYILDNAERFGMNRADVEAMAVPMLVRRRTTDVDRAQFAKRANDPTVAVMSASERAQSDAMEMPDATLLQTNADGTLNINGSMDYVHAFIQAMPQTERGMMQDADGRLSIDGERRIAAAITRQAYGDGNLVARIAEKRDDNSRTVANALLKHAPTLVQLAGMVAQGARKANTIAADLASAAAKYSDIRAAGQTVDDYFAQQQLIDDGMSDGAREALQFMGENNRSGKAIGEYIQGKIAEVEAAGDPRQPSLFDDTPEQSAAQSALIDNDIEMPTGELDADGNPIMMSGRDALALIEQETAVAQEQTTATQAAVSCALSRGL